MGQPVQVVAKRRPAPGIVRYEVDRSLTGMGHEQYERTPPAGAGRPPDVLAARLFETGNVQSVHVFSNVVTVTLRPEADDSFLDELVRELFIHYRPGVEPTAV